jgi:hypothetical protein
LHYKRRKDREYAIDKLSNAVDKRDRYGSKPFDI